MKYKIFISFLVTVFLFIYNSLIFAEELNIQKIFSENGKYRLETFHYNAYAPYRSGESKVYKNANDSLLYKINIALQGNTYLSNDGTSILRVSDSLEYYKNGKNLTKYKKCKIMKCLIFGYFDYYQYNNPDLWEYTNERQKQMYDTLDYHRKVQYIFYANQQKYREDADSTLLYAAKNSEFVYNDSLYIIDMDLNLIAISLKTGEYNTHNYQRNYPRLITWNIKQQTEENNSLIIREFPLTTNNHNLLDTISNYFPYYEFKFFSDNLKNQDYDKYKINGIDLIGLYDNKSYKFSKFYYSTNDNIDSNKIMSFIRNINFNDSLPNFIDQWYFHYAFQYVKKDTLAAKRDKIISDSLEYLQLQIDFVADSINSIYIPTNIDDCMIELDKIFSYERKEEIKEFKSVDEMSLFHFSYGMWMRNNWGLWGGSRLSLYFNELGILHPDNMSGIILDSYYYYYNNINCEYEHIINEYFKYEDDAEK